MTIKLIVGLANSGKKYILTRHNLGAFYVYLLAKRNFIFFKKTKIFSGYLSRLTLVKNIINLFIPDSFMNISGNSVKVIADFYHCVPENILVVHDDLDLIPGLIKIKFGGSHGGHNGVKDIIKFIGKNFYRLRIGIGRPNNKAEIVNFVLSKPMLNEKQLINQAINNSMELTDIMINDINKAINLLYKIKNNYEF